MSFIACTEVFLLCSVLHNNHHQQVPKKKNLPRSEKVKKLGPFQTK